MSMVNNEGGTIMKLEMNNLEQMEQLSEVQKAQQLEMEPPKLEKGDVSFGASEKQELPPKMTRGGMTLGESRDAFNKRRAFESADGKIASENRLKEYKEQLEEDARKKEEYRQKLYGDK